jgi:hypothetical protein
MALKNHFQELQLYIWKMFNQNLYATIMKVQSCEIQELGEMVSTSKGNLSLN